MIHRSDLNGYAAVQRPPRTDLVDVLFRSASAAATFSEPSRLREEFGSELAAVVNRRLQQLVAAPSLEHMKFLPGRCRPQPGEDPHLFTVDVAPPHRLVFHVNGHAPPSRDGSSGWAAIESITIVELTARREGS